MKRLFRILVTTSMALLSLLSCSKGEKYAEMMPKDTIAAIRIDIKDLIKESGIKGNKDILDLIEENTGSKKDNNLAVKLIKDPSQSGIDFNRDLVLAFTRSDTYTIIGLRDVEAFVNLFKDELSFKKDNGEIQYVSRDRHSIIVNDVFIHAEMSRSPKKILEAIDIKNKSKNKSDSFEEFCASDETVAIWFKTSGNHELRAIEKIGLNSILATIDFRKGGVDYEVKFYGLDKTPLRKGSRKLFKYMPEDPFLVLNADTGKLSEYKGEYQKALDEIIEQLGLTSSDLKKIGGDMTVAIAARPDLRSRNSYHSSRRDEALLSLALAIECKEDILDKIADKNRWKKKNGAYCFDNNPTMYIFNDDGNLVMMTEDLYLYPRKKGFTGGLADSPIAKDIPKNGLFINFKSSSFIMLLSSIQHSNDAYPALSLLEDLQSMTLTADSYNRVKGTILTTHRKEQAAKTILYRLLNIISIESQNHSVSASPKYSE